MYFHIEFVPYEGSVLYEMDLEEDEVHELAAKLTSGEDVSLGGRLVRWKQAQSMRIVRTDERWIPIYERAYALKRRRNITDMQHTREWHVFCSGEDVRRSILKTATPREAEGGVPDPRDVFVVHGRNMKARDALFDFLQAINLRPIEFTEALAATGEPNPYIGEVLQKAFSMAQAIVVFMTPDDEASLREEYRNEFDPEYETSPTPQARPNVLFEAGMAMGRDPDRTVLVQFGDLRPFSDVAGRHILRVNDDSQSRQQLADRLANAGCEVKLTGVRWHQAGDFSGSVPDVTGTSSVAVTPSEARLRAYMDKDFNSSGRVRHLLVLENLGMGEANEVEVVLDGVPVMEHNSVVDLQGEIKQIGPQSKCHYLLGLTMDDPIPSGISVTWINESGEPGRYNSTLSL